MGDNAGIQELRLELRRDIKKRNDQVKEYEDILKFMIRDKTKVDQFCDKFETKWKQRIQKLEKNDKLKDARIKALEEQVGELCTKFQQMEEKVLTRSNECGINIETNTLRLNDLENTLAVNVIVADNGNTVDGNDENIVEGNENVVEGNENTFEDSENIIEVNNIKTRFETNSVDIDQRAKSNKARIDDIVKKVNANLSKSEDIEKRVEINNARIEDMEKRVETIAGKVDIMKTNKADLVMADYIEKRVKTKKVSKID